MSKSNALETDLLGILFNATAIANIADNAGSGPLSDLYVSLHTANPGEAGNQETSEATYTSYDRVAVARTSGGWTVSGNEVENAATIEFPECTGGSNSITYFAVGTAASSTGKILYYGELTAPLAVSTGITPQFSAGSIVISED